jgi:hypothetical protein
MLHRHSMCLELWRSRCAFTGRGPIDMMEQGERASLSEPKAPAEIAELLRPITRSSRVLSRTVWIVQITSHLHRGWDCMCGRRKTRLRAVYTVRVRPREIYYQYLAGRKVAGGPAVPIHRNSPLFVYFPTHSVSRTTV